MRSWRSIPGGLYRFREGKLDQIPGISDVNQIVEDRDGGLWVAGIKELIYMRGGKIVRYDQKQGLPDRSVDIHQDSTGTLWIASYGGGLTRLRDGRLKAITTKDGLPNNMLAGLLEDSRGNLWVSSTQNIFRLSLKELNDFADGKIVFHSAGLLRGRRRHEEQRIRCREPGRLGNERWADMVSYHARRGGYRPNCGESPAPARGDRGGMGQHVRRWRATAGLPHRPATTHSISASRP